MAWRIGLLRGAAGGALRAALAGAIVLAGTALAAPPARADEAAEIRAVISDQLADFQENDIAGAFAHASPGIQGMFGTPERFVEMVQRGYPMVWRPARYEMLGLAPSPRGPVQTVLFEDRSGRLWEADYIMEQVEGVWRIDGVTLRQVPGLSS